MAKMLKIRADKYPVPLVYKNAKGEFHAVPRQLVEDASREGGIRDTSKLYPGDDPIEVESCRYYRKRLEIGDLVLVEDEAAEKPAAEAPAAPEEL
jgi:hypothetical protein